MGKPNKYIFSNYNKGYTDNHKIPVRNEKRQYKILKVNICNILKSGREIEQRQ